MKSLERCFSVPLALKRVTATDVLRMVDHDRGAVHFPHRQSLHMQLWIAWGLAITTN